ncbi:MAG: sigma 54-interacting transcriptional regulator [Myxococcales bacterium]|nr:sigma 54-interacting transcriptional regulator [Myxococcales bacterium]MCB9523687.1 sigma 54-interacting transcriptional regulator [Myxococcales bacterium]
MPPPPPAHHPTHQVLDALAALDATQVLADALDTLPGGLFTVNAERVITSWNAEMAALTGYRADEIIGRSCGVLQADACFSSSCVRPGDPCGLWEQGAVFQKRCTLKRKDGQRIAVVKNARLLYDREGRLHGALESALDVSDVMRLEAEVAALQREVDQARPYPRIVGEHPLMQQLYNRITLAAEGQAPVLVTGETGAGKGLVVEAIHEASARRHGPLVWVNCGTLPEGVLLRELFGHVRGAFAGALADRKGRIEAADGGTLVLDDFGALPDEVQIRLLRLVRDGELVRLGESQSRRVDVRLISASNQDLRALMDEDLLREDLYYRLAVVPIEVPPLRARMSDIPELASHVLARTARRRRDLAKQLSAETLTRLQGHDWPGNVRELEQSLEYATVLTRGLVVEPCSLPPDLADPACEPRGPKRKPRPALDARRIHAALEATDGHKARAAERLGVSRVTLWKWMKRLGLDD